MPATFAIDEVTKQGTLSIRKGGPRISSKNAGGVTVYYDASGQMVDMVFPNVLGTVMNLGLVTFESAEIKRHVTSLLDNHGRIKYVR